MEPIEDREIPGFTLKTMLTIIICTGSIMLTVLGTYFNLKADVTDVRTTKDSEAKLNDLKMRVMDNKIDALEIQIKDLKSGFDAEQLRKH